MPDVKKHTVSYGMSCIPTLMSFLCVFLLLDHLLYKMPWKGTLFLSLSG